MSLQVVAMAQYSASAEDQETVVCFLDLHEMGEEPNIMQQPVIERHVFGQLAQSES